MDLHGLHNDTIDCKDAQFLEQLLDETNAGIPGIYQPEMRGAGKVVSVLALFDQNNQTVMLPSIAQLGNTVASPVGVAIFGLLIKRTRAQPAVRQIRILTLPGKTELVDATLIT